MCFPLLAAAHAGRADAARIAMRVHPELMWINVGHPCVRMMVFTIEEEVAMEDDSILCKLGPTHDEALTAAARRWAGSVCRT
jgi:hypothetical protein